MTQTELNNYWGHTLDGYAYQYNLLGERTNVIRNLGLTASTVSAGYDNIGELTSWSAQETNGSARLNEQLAWAYDAAGNLNLRTNGALVQTFGVNVLNELTNVTRTGTLTVSGNTPAPATNVTVNGLPAQIYGDLTFASTNHSLANGINSFTNVAQNVYGLTVTNAITANLPASVALQFDSNGNLTNDGLRSFSYDAENELTNVTLAGSWRSDFIYDGLMRRRIERDYNWNGSSWAQTDETRYIYDGNLVVQERDSNNVAQVTYTRGLDLSGTLQGAGGIGGLLARTDTNGPAFYHADGNGNVTALMDGIENIVARYLYGPFGNTLAMSGPLAGPNTYRFSSKEWNANSGLYYFLYRFYDPNGQRWLNVDPIQEQGGLNLYAYVGNNPIINNDLFGLAPATVGGGMSMFTYLMSGDLGANIQLSSGLIQQASQSLPPSLVDQLDIVLANKILKCCQSGSTAVPLSSNSQIPIEDTSGSFGFVNTGNWQVRAIAHCGWKCGKSSGNDKCSCSCTANCIIDVYLSKTYTFEPGYNQYNSQLAGVKYGFYPLSAYEQMFWHLNPNPAYFVSAHFQIPYSSSNLKPRCR